MDHDAVADDAHRGMARELAFAHDDDITTLGRGGSDTSAVALAAALHADLCQIYTDVDGVYTADPRLVPGAHKLDEITYDEMLELATLGAGDVYKRQPTGSRPTFSLA